MAAGDYKTLREVGVAMEGVQKQLGMLKWVIGGSVGIGVVVSGVLYTKIDGLENTTVRIETTLQSMDKRLEALQRTAGKSNERARYEKLLSWDSADGLAQYIKKSGWPIEDFTKLKGVRVAVPAWQKIGPGDAYIFSAKKDVMQALSEPPQPEAYRRPKQ